MVAFGEELRREREERGVALEAICTATKVPIRHIRALEAGASPVAGLRAVSYAPELETAAGKVARATGRSGPHPKAAQILEPNSWHHGEQTPLLLTSRFARQG